MKEAQKKFVLSKSSIQNLTALFSLFSQTPLIMIDMQILQNFLAVQYSSLLWTWKVWLLSKM